MATSVDQTDFIKTALRLPRALHARLMSLAQERGISLNTQIIESLQRALDDPTVDLSDKSLDAIEARLRSALRHK